MKLSDAEWQIMKALWKHHPATTRDILEHLPKNINWAYTTVKTMLSRLVVKKAISERKRANTSVYEPLISQKNARQNALRSLVNKVLDGTVEPLVHYLIDEQKLTIKQRQRLIKILEDMESSDQGEKNGNTE
jgi:BlaI family penicillinase repressor